MNLPTRPLGNSELNLTTLGCGSWAIGGGEWAYGWGPQDDQASIAAIRHAVECGINWIDTAAAYGFGHSEEVVGRAVRDLPLNDRPLVFTKCGVLNSGDAFAEPVRVLRPDSIRAECEASLRRLGIERIDLYQFHWPDEAGTPLEDSWAEMGKLIDEGKVRCGGVSNFSVSLLERCQALRQVASLQPPFSLIHREAGDDVIPWCASHHTGVIAYAPMQSGMLTETFSLERVQRMAEGDWRRSSADFQEPSLSRSVALRDALRPVARRHGTNVSSVAIAWVLSWPGVTGAIVGSRSPDQVGGWIDAASLQLDENDLDEIAAAIERTGAGAGPVRRRALAP
ncbi:MAG: aldo/keto reductase [Chloroflexota bacterium]|nr:aldo/keto reductase [Chloroflexota bacterium]